MAKYAHDDIVPFEASTLDKKEQVADMFNSIAFRYDFLNRFLSAGIDINWRKKAIKELAALQPKIILDVATGTADVALLTQKILKPKKIIGIDISPGMLDVGRTKIAAANLQETIELTEADSATIPFAENYFDAITVAFGVRNFQHLEKGMAEMYRVLKPGGKLVVLEFSKPTTTGFKQFYNLYMDFITPSIGKVFSNNKAAYAYLNKSVQAFPEGLTFLNIMNEAGFTQTYLKKLSFGICTIYCGSK
ncbi:MAG: bifunctional demethylmenaquinone methyltransferase/2-methoxy-6-polyprenyl-1,4-benzoquinol methylase UbiE [Chitinophagaceae bacterium]|jgi:demethylmenaquinone methyltransferase/2-methoxy-6-polyprenyl-1,4-benzoquinol methylase|nr:bifunctional demethylmenaquinone methyltransferase/2-methoxy-6-polyprenyl-1,4-benzoquinol methylase UbiE [Chitinophagaceae bacterium]